MTNALEDGPTFDDGGPRLGPAQIRRISSVLLTSTAGFGGLLAVLGLNSERVLILLDQEGQATWFLVAALTAILAIGCGLAGTLAHRPHIQKAFFVSGVVSLVAALASGTAVATNSQNLSSRPAITSISLVRLSSGVRLEVDVHADRLDDTQWLEVAIASGGTSLYRVRIPSDRLGIANQRISLDLSRAQIRDSLSVTVWRPDKGPANCGGKARFEAVCAVVKL